VNDHELNRKEENDIEGRFRKANTTTAKVAVDSGEKGSEFENLYGLSGEKEGV